MCGITGVYDFNARLQPSIKKVATRMTKLLAHRGSDDRGVHQVDKHCVLGHARLSILDLSKAGHQPMADGDKHVWITFNGEIYNFEEIRNELIAKGHNLTSQTDTEVILYAYKEWGIDCIKRFNGMFAMALYDTQTQSLFIVRDRLGIKPLYYTRHRDTKGKDIFIFSSEIKSLLAYPGCNKKLNKQAISSYLSFRYSLGEETLFENIYSLQPGTYMVIAKDGSTETVPYWDIPQLPRRDRGEEYYAKQVKELLTDSVKLRMISDVPLGAYLSGGLDSSLVVAIMSRLTDKPVKTFTIGFSEKEYNEFEYARLVADMYKADHHEILLQPDKYVETLKKLIKYKDLPLSVPNEVPLYIMSKELKKHITVVLSGEGADEIFGGYGRLFRSPTDYKKMKLLRLFPKSVVKRFFPDFIKKYGRNGKLRKFASPTDHFLHLYTYFPFEEKKFLFTDEMNALLADDFRVKNMFKKCFAKYKNYTYEEQMLFVFEKMHLPGLLGRVDTSTMATTVEGRVPFVDHRLVSFVLSIPRKYKIKWKSFGDRVASLFKTSDDISEKHDTIKHILKKAFRGYLPPPVVHRKKIGFPVPLDYWFKNDFKKLIQDALLSDKARIKNVINQQNLARWIQFNIQNPEKDKKFGQKLWMIYNLELWLQEYFTEADLK